jgi:hypothetical protein
MRYFKTEGGHKKHWNASHSTFGPATTTTPRHAINRDSRIDKDNIHEVVVDVTGISHPFQARFWLLQ